MYMKPFHGRNDSGELDVFEASRYFAGAAELSNGVNLTTSHKGCDQKPRFWRTGGPRISLDMPNVRSGSSIPSSSLNGHHLIMENKQSTMVVNAVSKEKKHKQQPSSPGGKLASFLNSLFNQTSSSKKKKSSMKDNDESPGGGGGWRRRRRSSISHFGGSSTTSTNHHHHHQKDDTKSANTPIKVITIPSKIMVKPSSAADHYAWLEDNKFQWDRKHRIYANGYSEQKEIFTKKNQLLSQVDHDQKHDYDDDVDGVDEDGRRNSDSSSDLFELQNYNLGYDSCGLPVYETTNMDRIKISPLPISSGAK